jgi:hypothetical protein
VAHLSVTDQVDNDVALELLTELSCKLESTLNILHTISIHVEDGSINCLGDISGVNTGAALAWVSSETNLVVHNDVDCTTDPIVGKRLHLKLFKHHTLTGKSSVTVHNDRHHSSLVFSITAHSMLLGSDSTHDHWVNCL